MINKYICFFFIFKDVLMNSSKMCACARAFVHKGMLMWAQTPCRSAAVCMRHICIEGRVNFKFKCAKVQSSRCARLRMRPLGFYRCVRGSSGAKGTKNKEWLCFPGWLIFKWQSGQHDDVDTVEHKDAAKFSCHWLFMTCSWDNLVSALAGVQMVLGGGRRGEGFGRAGEKSGTSRLRGL